jgi:hypothetical protein
MARAQMMAMIVAVPSTLSCSNSKFSIAGEMSPVFVVIIALQLFNPVHLMKKPMMVTMKMMDAVAMVMLR